MTEGGDGRRATDWMVATLYFVYDDEEEEHLAIMFCPRGREERDQKRDAAAGGPILVFYSCQHLGIHA